MNNNNENDSMYTPYSGNPIPSEPPRDPYDQGSNGTTPYGQPTYQTPYGQPMNQPPNEQAYSNTPYGQPMNQNPYISTEAGNNPNYQGSFNQTNTNQTYTNSPYTNQTYNTGDYTQSTAGVGANFTSTSSLALQPRKKAPKWLWGLTAIPAIILITVICYFTIPSVKNFFLKNFMSTEKYYARVEEENTKNTISTIKNLIETYSNTAAAQEGSLSFHLSDAVTAQIPEDFGDIGEFVNNLTLEFYSATKDAKTLGTFQLKYKEGEALLTLELYFDTNSNKYYLRLPELSDTYLEIDVTTAASLSLYGDTIAETLTAKLGVIDSNTVIALLEKYMNLFFDELAKEGTLSKDTKTSVSISGLTKDCTSFTIDANAQQIKEIATNILEYAKKDDTLIGLINTLGLNSSMFQAGIDSTLAEIKTATSTGDSRLNLVVYADDMNIIGRTISFIDNVDDLAISYLIIEDGNKTNAEFKMSETNEQLLSLLLKSESSDSGSSGDITATADGTSVALKFSNVSFIDDKDSFGKVNGTFSFTESETLQSIALKATATKDAQDIQISYSLMNAEAFTLTVTTKKAELKEFSLPPTDQTISMDDEEALQNYILNSNYQTVIKNIGTALGYSEDQLNEILASLMDVSTPDYNDPLGGDDDDINNPPVDVPEVTPGPTGTLNPSDSGLPEHVTIDSDGYYSYDLTDNDLTPGVAGNAYLLFDVLETTMQPIVKSSLSLLSSNTYDEEVSTRNYASGNVLDNYGVRYQILKYDYIASDYNSSIGVEYDSVTKQLIRIAIDGSDVEGLKKITLDLCSAIKGSALTSEETTSLQSGFNMTGEDYKFIAIGNTEVYVSLGSSNDYYISIEPLD